MSGRVLQNEPTPHKSHRFSWSLTKFGNDPKFCAFSSTIPLVIIPSHNYKQCQRLYRANRPMYILYLKFMVCKKPSSATISPYKIMWQSTVSAFIQIVKCTNNFAFSILKWCFNHSDHLIKSYLEVIYQVPSENIDKYPKRPDLLLKYHSALWAISLRWHQNNASYCLVTVLYYTTTSHLLYLHYANF